eukprot:Hpha_TRINITY_DN13307_c0_g1::TRINITY_DN13307_c0_g1_i1::g.95372::m.95372
MMRMARMRGVVSAAGQARGIHTVWGGFDPRNGWLSALFGKKVRSSDLTHLPCTGGWDFSDAGKYLSSAIKDDTRRLLAQDWTHGFDGWWKDQVGAHVAMYNAAYLKQEPGLDFLVKPVDSPKFEDEKAAVSKDLEYLKSAFKWAAETEKCYSAIFDLKFEMERYEFDPIEREKLLASATELYLDFLARVPAEFKQKAGKELEWHLFGLRHWVWDAPHVKSAFPRVMA